MFARRIKQISRLVESISKHESTMPTPKKWPLLGTIPQLLAAGGVEKMHLYVDKRHRELGPIYKESWGPITAVFMADPDDMRRVFALEGKHPRHFLPEPWLLYNKHFHQKRGILFMDGEEWIHYRRILNKTMLKADETELPEIVDTVAQDLVTRWSRTGCGDLEAELYQWSLEVIVAVLLGKNGYKTHIDSLMPLIKAMAPAIHSIFVETSKLSLLPPKLAATLKLPVWRRFVRAANSSINIGNNMVDMMMKLVNTDTECLLNKLLVNGVDVEHTKRIVTDLILAAGDTTAYTTQWMLYLLAKNPSEQEEIYQQLVNQNTKEMSQNTMLRAVLKETLRMYPVAPFITRYLPKDECFHGFTVRAEDLILMSLYTSGRDETNFQHSAQFKPERWLRQNETKQVHHPFASIPFAMGARSCVGRKIAEQQICLTVGQILKKFKINVQNKNVEIMLKLITVPSEKIKLLLQPRFTN